MSLNKPKLPKSFEFSRYFGNFGLIHLLKLLTNKSRHMKKLLLNFLLFALIVSCTEKEETSEKHITVESISTGTAADGSKFELPICTIFTIENGKITKDFTYYDNLGE